MKKNTTIWGLCLLSASLSSAKPVIFWASDPIKPNETIMAQGDDLADGTRVQLMHIDNGPVSDIPVLKPLAFGDQFATIDSLQASEQTGKYVVPADMELGLYAIRPVKKDEIGKITLLNAPTAWWIQGDQVQYSVPEGKFSIFGKCLSYNNASKVVLKDKSGKYKTVKITEQDLWHIELDLENMATGEYEVYVHNGMGGDYGWSTAGKLMIQDKLAWPTKVFNVLDYGAKPSTDPKRSNLDTTNDSPAFQKALDAAGANGGGVVLVPTGCYRLEDPINIPRFVTLKGESHLLTNLGWTDRDEAHLGLINGTNSFAVKDLSIFVQNYWSVIRGDHGHADNAGNITVQNVTIRANRQLGIMNRLYPEAWKEMQIKREWDVSNREAPLHFGGQNIAVIDCDVIASHNSIILDKASGVLINNKLHCPQTFQNSQYWLRGCHDLIISGNDIYGGGCMGTHNTTRGKVGSASRVNVLNATSKNIYFANNYQHDNWKWDREMMTLDSHGYDGPYIGPVASGTGNTVVIPPSFPVLSVGGMITSKSGGALISQKSLKSGEDYKIVIKMESKQDQREWDRCFVNYYDANETVEKDMPKITNRNGDSRHYEHGKVKGARIRGAKGFTIKDARIAKSWADLQNDEKSQILFTNVTLDGKQTPSTSTDVVFDFDQDGDLYLMATVKANGASTTGSFELMGEKGRAAVTIGINRIGGKTVNFNGDYRKKNQNTGNLDLFKGALVYVLEGKGCGQYREIIGGQGNTLTLDRPWDVDLDKTSVISVHRTQQHLIFSKNRFDDGGNAMLLYGGSVENILANNTTERSSGYSVTGLGGSATMFCQFLDNDITSGAGFGGPPFNLRGGQIAVEPYRPVGFLRGYQTLGIVIRNNNLNSMATVGISGPVQNVLIENNRIANTQTGVIVDSVGMGSNTFGWYWPQDVLIRDNVFENVETLLEADSEATVKMIEKQENDQ